MPEPFKTIDEFADALSDLIGRTKDLDPDEVEAEMDGQILGLHDRRAAEG
jgi:hypothetical protein